MKVSLSQKSERQGHKSEDREDSVQRSNSKNQELDASDVSVTKAEDVTADGCMQSFLCNFNGLVYMEMKR
jgi:hypothetical protein